MNEQVTITDRTKQFAIRVIKACSFLDKGDNVARTLGRQLLRSGTSIGANVRESRSAQSDKDFLSKLEIALKEARETQYWIEILIESGIAEENKFKPLLQESTEILAILVSSTKKIKERL